MGKLWGALVFVVLASVLPSTAAAEDIQVLKDPNFKKGFRVNPVFCRRFGRDPQWLQLGNCVSYKRPTTKLRSIPDAAGTPRDAGKFWSFEEGGKMGLICTDPSLNGGLAPDAYPTEMYNGEAMFRIAKATQNHRLAVGAKVTNSKKHLRAVVRDRQGQTVRAITTDRKGTLRMAFNSALDTPNIAVTQSSCFRYHTWPHFLLVQHFKEPFALSTKKHLPFRVTLTLNAARQTGAQLTPWDNASLVSYFFLRHKENPAKALWVGLLLYTTSENYPGDIVSADQWGLAFVRYDAERFGGRLGVGETRTIAFDLKALVSEALQRTAAQSLSPSAADEYEIADFNIGWENVGNFRTVLTLKSLSLKATDTP